MIDRKKRQTLKGMAAAVAGSAVGSIPAIASSGSLTESTLTKSAGTIRQVWPPIAVKSPIALSTRVSTLNNDIEIVLTNKSAQPVALTQITPSQLCTPQGSSDHVDVLNNALCQLAPGENVSVPLQYHATNSSARSQQKGLSAGLSVTTDADQFTAVSYVVNA